LKKKDFLVVTRARQQWQAWSLQERNNKDYLKVELHEFQVL
jgi:hypothetical protein